MIEQQHLVCVISISKDNWVHNQLFYYGRVVPSRIGRNLAKAQYDCRRRPRPELRDLTRGRRRAPVLVSVRLEILPEKGLVVL